jgi:hypothetical protein
VRIDPIEPPREFGVGTRGGTLRHVADMALDPDEVVTFRGPAGSEVDVTRKEWGYYLTTSLNQRLAEHGLRAALCMGVPRPDAERPRMYLLAVEEGGDAAFAEYLAAEGMRVVAWLDTDDAVERVAALLD